jgi:hypothetical protein
MFDNMSRLTNEDYALDDVENVKTTSYMLNNYISSCDGKKCKCGCANGTKCKKSPILFGTSQPGVFFKSGNGPSATGVDVDHDTQLTYGLKQLNRKTEYDIHQRTYLSIPYLGRGSGDSKIESMLRNGELMQSSRHTESRNGETSYIDHHLTPLQPDIKKAMVPERFIESAYDSEWIRGGVPTRELFRDSNKV